FPSPARLTACGRMVRNRALGWVGALPSWPGRGSIMPKKQKSDASASQREEDAEFLEEHREGLSKSTQRAKWIHAVDEHEDRPGQTLATRVHEVICRWAEERGARPATVDSSEESDRPRVLRLNFPGYDEGGK